MTDKVDEDHGTRAEQQLFNYFVVVRLRSSSSATHPGRRLAAVTGFHCAN
jgi:hypothetical protein